MVAWGVNSLGGSIYSYPHNSLADCSVQVFWLHRSLPQLPPLSSPLLTLVLSSSLREAEAEDGGLGVEQTW